MSDKNQKSISFSEEEVKQMLLEAFTKGENFGCAYQGWYIPTLEEKTNRASKDCLKIFDSCLKNRDKIGKKIETKDKDGYFIMQLCGKIANVINDNHYIVVNHEGVHESTLSYSNVHSFEIELSKNKTVIETISQ